MHEVDTIAEVPLEPFQRFFAKIVTAFASELEYQLHLENWHGSRYVSQPQTTRPNSEVQLNH